MRGAMAMFILCCITKKSISTDQLHRMLKVKRIKRRFMLHRIRHAMAPDSGTMLTGTVEVDETYVGSKGDPAPFSAPQDTR